MGLEFGNKYEQQQVNIEEKETSLEQKLDFLSNATGEKKDYKNFIKFLETIQDKQKKEQLVNFLEKNKNNEDVFVYFEDGFPITEQGLNDFFKEFKIKEEQVEKKEEQVEKKEEQVEKKEEQVEKRTKLAETQEEIEENRTSKIKKDFEKFLSENNNREKLSELNLGREFIKQIEKSDFSSAEEFLKQHGQDLFKQIANSPNLTLEERKQLFETTKSFVGSNFLDIKVYNFDFYIGKWDNIPPNPAKILEDAEGNLSDNMVSLDLDHIPPKYDLGRVDSDYKFTNKLNSNEVSEFTSEYLDEIKSIQELTKNLGKLGKGYSQFKKEIGNLWKENAEEIQKGDFSDFKEGLQAYLNKFRVQNTQNLERMYDDLDIPDNLQIITEDINELGNIKNPDNLKQKFQNFEEKYKKLQEYVNSLPQKVYKKYRNKLQQKVINDTRENREKQKEVLVFLHKTGFDLIPKNYTDRIIENIQNNIILVKGLNLNPQNIDLKNGKFGESPTESNGTKWKQNLIDFMNKMIFGEVNPKNNLLDKKAFVSPLGASINPTQMQEVFKKQGIKSDASWNIHKMRENLKK